MRDGPNSSFGPHTGNRPNGGGAPPFRDRSGSDRGPPVTPRREPPGGYAPPGAHFPPPQKKTRLSPPPPSAPYIPQHQQQQHPRDSRSPHASEPYRRPSGLDGPDFRRSPPGRSEVPHGSFSPERAPTVPNWPLRLRDSACEPCEITPFSTHACGGGVWVCARAVG